MKTKSLETYLKKAIAPDGSIFDVPVTIEVEYNIPSIPVFVLSEPYLTDGEVLFDNMASIAASAKEVVN